MDRLRAILDALKAIWKYTPYFWLGVRTLFALWKARLQQKAVRDALEKERDRRISAERELGLSNDLAGTFHERRERALRDAIARELARRGGDGQHDHDPDR